MRLDVRRAGERYVTHGERWVGRYCFSYGEHYDPENVSFGHLIAFNQFDLEPGAGFEPHEHRGIEVVTWVLEGTLRHSSDLGEDGVLCPGEVQVLSAGRGVRHAEVNASRTEPLRFLQMWVASSEPGGEPSYGVVEAPTGAGLVRVAVPLRQPHADLYAGTLEPGRSATVARAFVFVTSGHLTADGVRLGAGDSVRVDRDVTLAGAQDAHALVWAMSS